MASRVSSLTCTHALLGERVVSPFSSSSLLFSLSPFSFLSVKPNRKRKRKSGAEGEDRKTGETKSIPFFILFISLTSLEAAKRSSGGREAGEKGREREETKGKKVVIELACLKLHNEMKGERKLETR